MVRRAVEVYKEKLMVITAPDEDLDKIRESAPKWYPLPADHKIAVPWTWEESAWLTAMGIPAVSPIFRDYKWPRPRGWEPMAHQIRIADFCVRNRRGYVLAGTGTGKTASLTWAVDYLMNVGAVKRALVLCPLSVMTDAWTPTLRSCLIGRRRVTELYGPRKKRMALAEDGAEIHVINFDGLEMIHAELMANNYDAVIIDESTAVKNRNTKRWKLVKPLVDQARFAWQLTGTPTPQGPDDAYGQLVLFDRFGNTRMPFTWWQDMTSYKVNKFKRVLREGWQQKVHKYMRPAIRIRTRDCIDLPPITHSRRHVPVTAAQSKAIATLLTHQMVRLAGRMVEAPNKAVVLGKLAQICAGAVFDSEGDVIEVKPSGRLAEVERSFEQAEGKVIVYAPFKAAVRLVVEHMRKKGFKVAEVTGDTPKKTRQKIFDDMQLPDRSVLDGLVAVPDAMAHGVTLTEASEVVWYAPTSRAEIYKQAIARMERKGQQRHMTVTHIWGHPREKDLYDVVSGLGEGELTLLDLYEKIAKGIMD